MGGNCRRIIRILPTAITNAFSPFGTNTFAGDAGDEDDEAGGGRFVAGADREVGSKVDPFVLFVPRTFADSTLLFGTYAFAGDAGDEDDEAGGGRFLAGADGEVGGKVDPFVFFVPPISIVILRFGAGVDEDEEGGTGGAAPPETPESDDEARNEDCTAAA